MGYTVYVIECETPNHWYVGFSQDVHHRIVRHHEKRGAHFTRAHGIKRWGIVGDVATVEEAKRLERQTYRKLRRAGRIVGGFGKALPIQPQPMGVLPCGCIRCPTHA